jgi:outer membrane receptor protein involved in Fe transport
VQRTNHPRFALLARVVSLATLCTPGAFAADARNDSLEAVIVTAERIQETPPTEATIQTEKLLDIPGSFGDPLQSVFALPGVLPSSEFGGAPAVRGSGPEDNYFLTDFLPTGYLFHAFGFSIFNENLIRDFGIKNAGFGAPYGRATGAVFDVKLREPRQQPWTTTLDGSFLRVGAMIEGELTDSQALYVSARESTVHLLLKARRDALEDEEDITFDRYPRARDVQAKYSWRIDDANRLSLLVVGAYDATGLNFGETADLALIDPGSAGDAKFEREFLSQALNWHYDDGTNTLRTAIGHLQMSQDLRFGNLGEYSNNDSHRWTARTQFARPLGLSHTIAVGAEYQHAEFEYSTRLRYRSCSRFTPDCEFERGPMTEADDAAVMRSATLFVEDRWQVAPTLTLTLGLRGEHDDYLDETYFEPRLGAAWELDDHWELRAMWGQYHQSPRIAELLPVFGNPELEPIEATHYVLGVTHRLDDTWSWNAEVYYKDLANVVVDVPTDDRYLNAATGKAYGIELMINKNRAPYEPGSHDRFYGWFTLGLAKTERRNALNGTTAVFDYDAPVVANLVVNYRWNRAWDAGLRWTYRSGMPYTPIVGNRENPNFPGYYLPVFGDLNDARAAPYHRLDLRIERQFLGKRLRGSVYLDILNAYARENGGAVHYKPVPNSSTYELEEEDALPLLPSIGVKLIF